MMEEPATNHLLHVAQDRLDSQRLNAKLATHSLNLHLPVVDA